MHLELSALFATQLQSYPLAENFEGIRYQFDRFYGFDLRNSIPYQALLTRDFSRYADYVRKTGQKEHSPEAFLRLYNEFDLTQMPPIQLLYWEQIDRFSILDGVHRLSVLLQRHILTDTIPLDLLHINYPKETVQNLLLLLRKTTRECKYNGWKNSPALPAGYHSFSFANIHIRGQRDAAARLNEFRKHVSFKGKNVVDFGCNTGGMLLHLPEIRHGLGLDYDADCIAAATYINKIQHLSSRHLEFVPCDLIQEETKAIRQRITFKPDILFLLSLGSWITNWPRLYQLACDYADATIILEVNNAEEGKTQLEFFRQRGYDLQEIVAHSTDDITGNARRQTYLARRRAERRP